MAYATLANVIGNIAQTLQLFLVTYRHSLAILTLIQCVYTHVTSKFRIQLELETPLGKVLIEDNSYSIVKINTVV